MCRISVIGIAVGQIVVTERSLRSSDQTWAALSRAILDQVVVHASIIHATLPRIHSFLANLQTGLLATRVTSNIPLSTPKDRSRNSKGSARLGSGVEGLKRASNRISFTISPRLSKGSGRPSQLISPSQDIAYLDYEKRKSAHSQYASSDAEGNFVNGLKLRPDIVPGSKWQTTIYADPEGRGRQHSASTKDDGDRMAMGSRIDEENSESSLHDGRSSHGGDLVKTHHSLRDESGRRDSSRKSGRDKQHDIWKTREFQMQIERVGKNGEAVDVTTLENRAEQDRAVGIV